MNWERVNIVSVASITNEPVEEFLGEKIYIATGDLKEKLNDDVSEKVTFDNRPSRANLTAKKGDVILARMKGTDKVMVINEETEQYIYSTGFLVLRPNESLDKDFLYYFLRTKTFQREKDSYCTGATQKAINNANFSNNLTIPLPPMSVQKEIVEKLDKAAAIREKSKALLAYYDALAESLFIELFGDPISNEKGWEKKKLGEVCVKIGSGATPRGGRESYLSKGISFIRSLNVYDREFKYKDLAFIDENQAYDLRNVIVEEGDVLFNITGASVCRSCVVPLNVLPARVNQHVSILRCKKDIVNPIFLNAQLVSDSKKNQLIALSKIAGATREAITKVQLENEEILIPPLSLQVKFAEMIENIEKQKARAKAEIEQSEAVFQALLQESFG